LVVFLIVALLALGGLNVYTYAALSSRISNSAAELNSLKENNTLLENQLFQMGTELNSVYLTVGNLTIKLDLAQDNISQLTSELNSIHALRVYQVNYVGDGLAGHDVSVPFAPVLVFIVDYTAGMQATVYFGTNESSEYIFRGLQLYEAGYISNVGGTCAICDFYHGGMFDISEVGSAPAGTMNTMGDEYYAIFYG
jgi:hypothetical protein